MEAAKLIVFTWLTFVMIWACVQIWKGVRQTVLFCLVVHWMFCGLPLLYDIAYGLPVYSYINMSKASVDPLTNTIYLFYISIIPIILGIVGINKNKISYLESELPAELSSPASGLTTFLLACALPLPFIAVLAAPEPSLYLQYGFVADIQNPISPTVGNYHNYVTIFGYLSIIASVGIITSSTPLKPTLSLTMPWAFLTMFLVGKRYVVALYIALLVQRLWELGVLTRARLLICLVGATILFSSFNIIYQASIRNVVLTDVDPQRAYTGMRLDFGRDNTIKTAIYAETKGDEILDYRGESVVFASTFFVPRSWWPDKPFTYAAYMLSYSIDTPPRFFGWGFTTSIFDEAIANFSWFGMLIAPIFLGLLCRIADNNRVYWLKSVGVFVILLFMVVQSTAFVSLFLIWLGASSWPLIRKFATFSRSRETQTQ